jgi:hypothetical protein
MIVFRWPTSTVRAVLVGTAFTLAVPVLVPAAVSVQAGEFYTRKRVNGVWITGKFRRKHHAEATNASAPAVAEVEKAAKGETVEKAGKAEKAAKVEPVEKADKTEKAGKAETAEKADKVEKIRKPVAVTYLDPADDRKPAFQRAIEARQGLRRPEGMLATEDYVRLLPLQRALEAKARSLAETLPPLRNVKTVTYDFETGLRTSIYSDGSIAEEPFDSATGSISLPPP